MNHRYITQRKANEFVLANHRHHGKVRGSLFQLGCYVNGELVGVAIVGRPVARKLNAEEICELTRLATNETENACSKLCAACARIAKEMGFLRIITYILASEKGTSLKAAGWELDGTSAGGDWICRGVAWQELHRDRVES